MTSILVRITKMNSPGGTLQIRWDPKNLEIRTKSVEKTLEPLVNQVKLYTKYIIFIVVLIVITL